MKYRPLIGRWATESEGDSPPPFHVSGKLAVPVRLSRVEIEVEANASAARAVGLGRLHFTLSQSGRPLLDLVPDPTRVSVNGTQVPPERLQLVTPPDETTPLRMLDEELPAGASHELEIAYPLDDTTVQYEDGGVQVGFFMTDLDKRGFLERHAPAGFEFDQVPVTVEIRVSGTGSPHRLFTNGRPYEPSSGVWRVSFPDYFTCSSIYLHLTNLPLQVREGFVTVEGVDVPITAYARQGPLAQQALNDAKDHMRELGKTYGAYAHERLLIYCTANLGGGMEYAGATMTAHQSLGHEIAHSWFARGVMPANGNAGWIDEAIAYWRDCCYPRASAPPSRPPANLAGFSPYRRHTPGESYECGSRLLSEIDYLVGGEGLRPVLRSLYAARKRTVITTPYFMEFLEQKTGLDLGPLFDRYVYGRSGTREPVDARPCVWTSEELRAACGTAVSPSLPHGFTPEELVSLL
jgi:hypothetical protein